MESLLLGLKGTLQADRQGGLWNADPAAWSLATGPVQVQPVHVESRAHLDTTVVGVAFCVGGQPLQGIHEFPTILSGRALAVHHLEGLGMVRR